MEKKYKEILLIALAILTALVLIFNFAGDYYSDVAQSSSDYITYTTVYYIASHLFCDSEHICSYSNLSFPELQEQELQKYQDQIDWTSVKAQHWKNVSNQLVWISLVINIILIWIIWKEKKD